MPIKHCTIKGVDAKKKAIAQGVAIGDTEKLEKIKFIRESLAIRKVSFDYDGTLTQKDIQDIAKRLITAGGTQVYIISARNFEQGMYNLAKRLGIPIGRVIATGSNKAKIEKIKQLGISKHYDNSQDVIDALGNIGEKI